MQRPERFATDDAQLAGALGWLKLRACPWCGCTGTLVGHGFLKGYAERESSRVVRGRRVLCSNRYRRPGCGRTFSILLANLLARFVVRTATLYGFVQAVVAGATRKAAWQAVVGGAMSISSAYRLWRRVREAQSRIRTMLCRACEPPACDSREPLAHMVAHLQRAFAAAGCPLAAFQSHFQAALFS
jgi:hypothetical protein